MNNFFNLTQTLIAHYLCYGSCSASLVNVKVPKAKKKKKTKQKKHATIHSWQAHVQSKMRLFLKTILNWQRQLTGSAEFDMFIQGFFPPYFLLLDAFKEYAEQLSFSTQSHCTQMHTHRRIHTWYVKAATHVVSNLVGTQGPIRQTAQREVAPVMWNGSH